MMIFMENKKTLKDEIIEAIDGRFEAFERKMDGRFDSFERQFEGKIDIKLESFKRGIVEEFNKRMRYQGVLLERIEDKVDMFGDRVEMLEEKVDRLDKETVKKWEV